MPYGSINTLRPRQNGRYFADDIFKCIFLIQNVWIPIKISLTFVPKGLINNISAMVQIMAWRRPGDKPLSEPMMVWLKTHICVTRPQWVKPHWQHHRYPMNCIYIQYFLYIHNIGSVVMLTVGLLLGLHPANERRRHKATSSLIGCVQT